MTTDDLDRVLADIDSLLPPGASSPDFISADAMRWSPVDHDDHPARPSGGTTSTHTVRVTLERTTTDDRGSADVPYARDRQATPTWDLYDTARDWPSQVPPSRRRPVGEPDRGSDGLMQQRTGLWPAIWQTTPTPLPPADEPDRPDSEGVRVERSGWHLLTWPGLESVFRSAADYQQQTVREQMRALIDQAQHTTSNLQHLRDAYDRDQQAQAVIQARRNRNTGPRNPAGNDGRARRHQHPTRAPAPHAQAATQGWATPVIVRRPDGTLLVSFDPAWQ